MIRLQELKQKKITIKEFYDGLTRDHLRRMTNEMVDRMLGLIADCTDADVVFTPFDPDAEDQHAAEGEAGVAWNLGHVILHATASAEESAFLAAEQARGVEHHGRSRFEAAWETAQTVAFCRQRLEESRRMRLASLELWPNEPHLEVVYQTRENGPWINAFSRYVLGLSHDYDHLDHIAGIVAQASQARQPT